MDIVERLRDDTKYCQCSFMDIYKPIEMEAADEIERLREALQSIADIKREHIPAPTTPAEANLWGIIEGCVRVAEKTLGEEE